MKIIVALVVLFFYATGVAQVVSAREPAPEVWRTPNGVAPYISEGTGSFAVVKSENFFERSELWPIIFTECYTGTTTQGWCMLATRPFVSVRISDLPSYEQPFSVTVGAPGLYAKLSGKNWFACVGSTCSDTGIAAISNYWMKISVNRDYDHENQHMLCIEKTCLWQTTLIAAFPFYTVKIQKLAGTTNRTVQVSQ